MPDQPGGPLWELARAAGDPGTLMPVSIDMWVLVMVLETLTAPLMFCSLIFQGEEGENPTSFHHHPTGAWENVPFRSNRPIRGEAGGKKTTSWIRIPRLDEIAANSPSLPIPGLMEAQALGEGRTLQGTPTPPPPPPPRTA